MQFNLLEFGYVTTNGTVYISLEDMANILSVSGTVTISGSNNDNIWIYGDIVDRIGTYQIRYYFDSATSSGTVASGISFSYKNDAADSFSSLTTNIGSDYYYTTVPGLSAPRYIRLDHTVSGTSIVGTIVGLEVINDDTVVDFGTNGNLTSDTTLTSLSYLNYNDYIKEIEVYNSGSSMATAHVFIDPQYNDSDELLSISASEGGPWIFARNIDYIISNGDNWNAGQYYQTSTTGIADGKLRLNPSFNYGTYTTPIFKNESVKFAYIDMLRTAVSGTIIAVDSDDYTSTLQIRSSNQKPIDYNVYRELVVIGWPDLYFYYIDYLMTTDVEVYNSYTAVGYFDDYYFIDPHTIIAVCCISITNQKCFYLFSYYSSHSGTNYYYMHIYLLTSEGVQIFKRQIHYRSDYSGTVARSYTTVYFVEIGYDDDIWLYLWTEKGGSNDLTEAGYYLLHYSPTGGLLYKEHSSSYFITGLDIVKDTSRSLWCIRATGTQAVIKISSTGTILVTYDIDITNLGRLCSTNDGGCWFIDDDALYKLDSSGVLVDSITNLEINSELTWVVRDESDSNFLWIIDGIYVKLISLDGRVYRSIYLGDVSIDRLASVSEGLSVYCTEAGTGVHYIKFIGRMSGGIDKTITNDALFIGYSESGVNYRAIKAVSYDNPVLGDMIPLTDDPVWNDSLPWNKAVTDNAVLPREEYNQLKLTLRRPDANIDSPTVNNIYYQDNVEIADIYPGQSKTLYLRISLPDGVTIGGDYESMLRVWWELPVT